MLNTLLYLPRLITKDVQSSQGFDYNTLPVRQIITNKLLTKVLGLLLLCCIGGSSSTSTAR